MFTTAARIAVLGSFFVWLSLPLAGGAATVEDPGAWCGTHPTVDQIVMAKHRLLERQRSREPRVTAQAGPLIQPVSKPQLTQEGDVVIFNDDGTVVQPPNPSDASNKGYRIQRKKKKFRLTKKPGGVSGSFGRRLSLGDDDSERVPFEKGFKFKFFGTTYTSVYVNSDGNLTFGEGDSASTARDLGRTLNGPARIMAHFTDLDPSVAGDVYVKFPSAGKMQVTWDGVPIFGGFEPNTFQVTLFKKGHVEFRFGEVNADSGIVGISPGGGAAVELLDFSKEAPTNLPEQAIAEVFGTEEVVDETLLAQVYYDNYPDDVHQLVVFYDFPLRLLGGGAVAYHFTTKNEVKGIGYKNRRSREIFDNSGALGSGGVLEGFANMGYVHKYNDNLNRLRDTITHLQVFLHEIGHQWMTRVYYRKGGVTSIDLQDDGGHWSFITHTHASIMQGNYIEDRGNGSFRTLERDAIFSDMDRYLMGMIPPEDVDDFFYVKGSGQPRNRLPEFLVNMAGERVDISVDDVIREEGPRIPSDVDSRKVTRLAMILLVRKGETAQQRSIAKVQDFVNKSKRQWSDLTDGVGSFDFAVAPN